MGLIYITTIILRMNASLQVILFWMLISFAPYSIPLVSCTHDDDRIVTIDKAGGSSMECCIYGKCHCSNLSLALKHIQSNTDIRIMSNISLQGAVNDSNVTMEMFKNLTNVYNVSAFVWLHEFILQFSHIITDCVNNLYGPAQVFTCCDDYSCDERYEYIVDSIHNNITMISNNTVTSCLNGEVCTFQIVTTANVNNTLVSTQIDIKLRKSMDYCKTDIAHFLALYYNGSQECLPLYILCNLSDIVFFLEGINCYRSESYDYFTVTPGYWFSNGFTEYVVNCPQGHCNSTFDLRESVYESCNNKSVPFPNSNDQCSAHWTGLACGECKENYIIHDSSNCVPQKRCTLHEHSAVILFFFISLLYWIIVISFIFVLLHFKFDITAGYAYGILFYYSILEQTVNASYVGTYNNLSVPTLLTILSSIGNMKPPFRLLKLCFWKNAKMMDHMFITYIHPVIVMFLIVIIFILARNSVTVARTIGRYVNSKSICILLMLSYSSVSYTSVQLFRPLAVYSEYTGNPSWRFYLFPTVKYFDLHDNYFYMVIYYIIAVLCEFFIGIGLPFVLVFQQYLTRYFDINFTSIKPIMDQLKGCYKEEYRWFAAYYLLCRQLLYAVDIVTDFMPDIMSYVKFLSMLTVYVLIIIVHAWLQPYKQGKLNLLDSCILVTLILVFIGEHITYGSTIILWILPLILFINCVALSTKLKYVLIPISCVGMITLCVVILYRLLPDFEDIEDYQEDDYQEDDYQVDDYQVEDCSFYWINLIVIPLTSFVFLAYMIYLCVIGFKRCCKRRTQYRLINVQKFNEDSHEDSDSDS